MYDSKRLAMLISQAARHLHAVAGSLATVLLEVGDKDRVLFSNSALSGGGGGGQMLSLAQHYLQTAPCDQTVCLHTHALEDGRMGYFMVLDDSHVFVAIGKPQDEMRVQEFVKRLETLLPQIQQD